MFDAVITHNRYTLLNQTALPVHQAAARRGMAVLNAAPYGSGMLAKGPDACTRYAYKTASPEIIETARQIEAICGRFGLPMAAVALQFSLRDPLVTTTVVGISKPERVRQTIDLARLNIPNELWQEVALLQVFSNLE